MQKAILNLPELRVCQRSRKPIASTDMQTINDILIPYTELEKSVRARMVELFSTTCGMCTSCCCRTDICEEAISSAFLSMLLKVQQVRPEDMDDRYGWLDQNGCSLKYGRPPICYAFFCDELLARLPDDDARYVTQVLGRLPHHVGLNALGTWNLVDIKNDEDLKKVDVARLKHRLEEAQNAFVEIEEFLECDRLSASARTTLALITTDDP
jgi:hypothetical protein